MSAWLQRTFRSPRVAIIAIICLTILELYALAQKINGAQFSVVAAAIAGIAGYATRPARE